MERYYTIKEVEQLLGVTSRTIYHWKSKGKIKFLKVGKKSVISKEDVEVLKKVARTKTPDNDKKFYTIKELTEELGVVSITVINWNKRGLIRFEKNGNKNIIPVEDVIKLKKDLGYDVTEEYYTVREFSEIYRASTRNLNTWAKEGKIKFHTVRGKHAIFKKDIPEILDAIKLEVRKNLK